MPAMNFRREFGAISGLSFVLVVVSSLVVGAAFAWLIPGLGLAWGIALGTIVSPTDAVATSIVKRAGAPSRVVTILEGESLLNDAIALVIMRAAIAGAAVSVSLWGVLYSFVYSIAVARIVGFVVGHLNLLVRAGSKKLRSTPRSPSPSPSSPPFRLRSSARPGWWRPWSPAW